MIKKPRVLVIALLCFLTGSLVQAADVVPTEVELPGTQPDEVSNFESPDKYNRPTGRTGHRLARQCHG